MMKISALNEESDDDSDSEKEEVTREALEEIALQQYGRTLELQKKGNFKDALKLLKDLLDTELLYEVEKPLEKDNITRPLLNLKYLCYRNIASLSSQIGDDDGAIEAYLHASELDDSDVTLWYRLGKISLQCQKFELASFAFQRGVDCNPKHWPCIDNLITILLGLGNYNDCIANIYDALELDDEYFRGRVYRKHIFTDYPHILEYLTLVNPAYKWKPEDDKEIGGEEYNKLVKESTVINEQYIEQINKNKIVECLPSLTLNKPVEKLSWLSLGESLTDMFTDMTENGLSYACIVEISQPVKSEVDPPVQIDQMDVDCNEVKVDVETLVDNATEDKIEAEKTEEPKSGNETEKEQTEQEMAQNQEANKSGNETKDVKKPPTRRRGSSLSFLEQWEWCTKRRSSRKKTVNRQDRNDETIYETLKRLLPQNLLSDEMKPKKVKDSKEFNGDDSMDTMDIYKLFEEKEKKVFETPVFGENALEATYFGSEKEEADVEKFISKYMEFKCDIMTMIDDFALTIAKLWKIQWPENLGEIFVKANRCSKEYLDPPVGFDNGEKQINNFLDINLSHLEIEIGRLMKITDDKKEPIDIALIDEIKILCSKYEGTQNEINDVILRYLWIKCHAHLYQDNTEFALDCLYQMVYEFNCLCEDGDAHTLNVPNFHNRSIINKSNTIELLKSLERNKQLSTVLNLYESGKYEEVLPILQDSFKNCQIQANKQEWSEMGLDWAVHLIILLEILWALENIEQCFTWAVVCLHEALKQYLMCSSGNTDYEKWSMTVIKIVMTIEHILKKEGSSYLEVLPEKALALMVQDIVQIIVHQLDELNTSEEMPIKTSVPWILLHYILQREEDCGRSPKKILDDEAVDRDDLPPSLMILFTGHNYLGKKGWCCTNDGHLLYFTLNAVLPRLRSPALSNVVETVSQCLEQIIFCLFGHPSKKTKSRYLYDHNVTPDKLDWSLSQQIFELYRPYEMPEFNSYRLGSISNETEQLFQRMLATLPSTYDPQPYFVDVQGYIENKKDDLPDANINYPYKMRDIYYLLADFYLKNNDTQKALKYYAYDIVICKNRFDSWAGTALAKASLLETKLNSCETFKTEMEYLNRAAAVERCFKKALEIDSSHSMLWIEYGAFVYGVHSFCSRMLKQASESLSMENFETLEKRKDDMLNTAHKCFVSAHREWIIEFESDDKALQDERWLHHYMLGKISEKKSEDPVIYLEHYVKAGQYLFDNNATYPARINYNNPQNLSVEALEIHYRIHASILKYIEQHENKKIMSSVGKAFKDCLTKCSAGPFAKKKQSKDPQNEKEPNLETTNVDASVSVTAEKVIPESPTELNGVKRPLETTEEIDGACKKPKLCESDASEINTEVDKIPSDNLLENSFKDIDQKDIVIGDMMETACEVVVCSEKDSNEEPENLERGIGNIESGLQEEPMHYIEIPLSDQKSGEHFEINVKIQTNEEHLNTAQEIAMSVDSVESNNKKETAVDPVVVNNEKIIPEKRRTSQESTTTNTVTSKDDTSSDSSSSSSDDSSSDVSSDSSSDTNGGKTDVEKVENVEMTFEEICEIISVCLDNLEDCVSRFPQHYKALYRLAHYHFYYKKDKNVERCKDLMLGSFLGRNNTKIQGLFSEKKNSNFFNSIWRIPASEVDRPGSFASHMSRCVLITMEILKEVDDYKTLLDLSLQLQRTPEAEKKYLRDAERGELSQQALSLCIRSIKGLFSKFNQTQNLSSNSEEKKAISNFMVDVYKSYQKVQKHMPTKSQAISLVLIDCFKMLTGITSNESNNLLELTIKHCQSLTSIMKQQSASPSVSSNATQNTPAVTVTQAKKPVKTVDQSKPSVPITLPSSFLPTLDLKQSFAKNMYNPQSLSNSFMPYMSSMEPLLSALSYVSNMGNIPGLGNATTSSPYRTDFLQQFMSTTLANSYLQQMKPSYNQAATLTKAKTIDVGKSIKSAHTHPTGIKRQMSTPNILSSSKMKAASQKNAAYYSSFNTPPQPMAVSTKKSISTNESTKNTASTIGHPNSLLSHTSSPNMYSVGATTNTHAKPAHQPLAQSTSNAIGMVKPAHMTTTCTVSAALHTKPPLPHQQVSPGKTLQEKLAERQKQNPSIPKHSVISKPSSPRSIACAAFSGKIPASLTITKSNAPMKSGSVAEEQKQIAEDALKRSRETKKAVRYDQPEKLPKSKNIVDSSEIIVLDDD